MCGAMLTAFLCRLKNSVKPQARKRGGTCKNLLACVQNNSLISINAGRTAQSRRELNCGGEADEKGRYNREGREGWRVSV